MAHRVTYSDGSTREADSLSACFDYARAAGLTVTWTEPIPTAPTTLHLNIRSVKAVYSDPNGETLYRIGYTDSDGDDWTRFVPGSAPAKAVDNHAAFLAELHNRPVTVHYGQHA